MDYPRALLWAYAAAVVLALAVAGSTSGAAFGAYNPAWDGASDLREEADAAGAEPTVVREVAEYPADPQGTVAVVLSPDRPYDGEEAARVRAFVRAGGTLVVAEDFGPHGDDLLAAVGAEARVDGRLLRDERHNYRSPALPVATNVSEHPRVDGVEELTLNRGTAVRPNGASVLVATSGFAYLDGDRDGELDDDESLGSRPVATVESVGDGRVIVVGDPSALINAMLERPGNRAFVRALFAGHDRAVLDYSHASGLPPLSTARLVVRGSGPLQLLLGVLAVLSVGVWTRRPGAVARALGRARSAADRLLPGSAARPDEAAAPASEAALVDYLAAEHPDWSRERVRRVVRAARGDTRPDGERDPHSDGAARSDQAARGGGPSGDAVPLDGGAGADTRRRDGPPG